MYMEGSLRKKNQTPAATPFSQDHFDDITVTNIQSFLQFYTFLHSRCYPRRSRRPISMDKQVVRQEIKFNC